MDTREKPQEQPSPGTVAPDTGSPELLEDITGTARGIAQGEQKIKPTATPLQESFRRLRKDTRAMISIGAILFFVVIALIGPPIYSRVGGIYHSPTTGNI